MVTIPLLNTLEREANSRLSGVGSKDPYVAINAVVLLEIIRLARIGRNHDTEKSDQEIDSEIMNPTLSKNPKRFV